MTLIKLMGLLTLVFTLSSCSTLLRNDPEPVGKIAFGVQSITSSTHAFNTDIGVSLVLKNTITGDMHHVNIAFEQGNRIVRSEELKAGVYLAIECRRHMSGETISSKNIEPNVSVEVVANTTTLFPQIVSLSAIYPVGGLINMDDKHYWQRLINPN